MTQQKTRRRTRASETRKKEKGQKKSAPLLKFEITGLILIFFGIFATIGILGVDTGSVGYALDGILAYGFGFGRIVVPLSLVIAGLKYIMLRKAWPMTAVWAWGAWAYELFLTLIHLLLVPDGAEFMPASLRVGGGIAGAILASVLRGMLGQVGAILFIVVASVVTTLLWKKWSIAEPVAIVSNKATEEVSKMSDKAVESLQDASTAIRSWQRPHIFDVQKEEAEEEYRDLIQAKSADEEEQEQRETAVEWNITEPEEKIPFTPVYTEKPVSDYEPDAVE